MNKKEYFERQKNRYQKGELEWCAKAAREYRSENTDQIMRIADEAVRLEFIFDLWSVPTKRRRLHIPLTGRICPQMIRSLFIR